LEGNAHGGIPAFSPQSIGEAGGQLSSTHLLLAIDAAQMAHEYSVNLPHNLGATGNEQAMTGGGTTA